MNSGAEKVTACVPAYNASASIVETLNSLRAQTYADLEILVSVDCPTDDTARICEELSHEDTRIQLRLQPSRLGWVENVNYLLREASGPYVFILAHDDVVHPEYVSALVTALKNNPAAALAYSDLKLTRRGRHSRRRYFLGSLRNPTLRGIAILFQVKNWWVPYRGILRRQAVQDCGGLVRSRVGEFAADWPWLLRLSLWGPLTRVPAVLYEKRLRPTSLSRTWPFTVRDWLVVDEVCRDSIRMSGLPSHAKAFLLLASRLCWLRHLIGVNVTRLLKWLRHGIYGVAPD